MAHQFTLGAECLLAVFTGSLTRADLEALLAETDRLEKKTGHVPNRLADFRPTTEFEVNYETIQALTSFRRERRFANPFKTALLTANSVQHGYARMFQTLEDNPQIQIRIFSDEAAARSWLARRDGDVIPEPGVGRNSLNPVRIQPGQSTFL